MQKMSLGGENWKRLLSTLSSKSKRGEKTDYDAFLSPLPRFA